MGQKKAAMAVFILKRDLRVPIRDMPGSNIVSMFAGAGPVVTSVRALTGENVDSIGFEVRKWIQCSAGYSWKASRAFWSEVSFDTALGHLAK
jgi:hypothetical protein